MYDARDLTTHAVCLGVTGSGKTGLCVDLLEEAALDGVPAIIIDPKGDMADLEEDFREEADKIARAWEQALDDVEEISVTPRRADIDVTLFALAWAPHWRIAYTADGRERVRTVPAYHGD